jgi:hypothetical protein
MALVLAAAQAPAQTLRGDFNNNGVWDQEDADHLAKEILKDNAPTTATDLNLEGWLNVADIILLIQAVNEGTWPPYTVSEAEEPPVWLVGCTYGERKPSWEEPEKGSYENWSILYVEIEDSLKPYVSNDDRMAVYVNDELRDVASLAIPLGSTDQVGNSFVLKVWGNESENDPINVTLQYYCSQLKHVFTISEICTMGEVRGIDDDYVPAFTQELASYPKEATLDVNSILDGYGIQPAAGDMVGAFVGAECRGVGKMADATFSPLTVHCNQVGESVALRYYNAAKGQVMIFTNIFETQASEN